MSTRQKNKVLLPIFKDYTLSYLAERLKYEESYLVELKGGRRKVSGRFIATACGILNISEADLFGAPAEVPDA